MEYDVEGFKKGRCTLSSIELEELDTVSRKSLLHLQCHFGMDTLSWARLGAKVTGVDFSNEAISLARPLSEESGIKAKFICSDMYELPDVLNEKFDIVLTSAGVLCWLPDLKLWAEIISHFLKPRGTFYIFEVHPFSHIFNNSAGVTSEREKRMIKSVGIDFQQGKHVIYFSRMCRHAFATQVNPISKPLPKVNDERSTQIVC